MCIYVDFFWYDIIDSTKHYGEAIGQITVCIEVVDLPIILLQISLDARNDYN